jgi:hypothetical protein
MLGARTAGGNSAIYEPAELAHVYLVPAFEFPNQTTDCLLLSNFLSSCFNLLERAIQHPDMATKTEISAADAAFLIDGLQHVASTVVVCHSGLSRS